MTAKEALREMLDDLTEEEARRLLLQAEAELAARPSARRLPYSGPTALDLFNDIQALFADVPDEEWKQLPAASEVDRVLYGDLARKAARSDA